ncbi:MAG TPA: prolyl oligopeptidase family serine peptidase [Fimbriimonadaceae bacterium]|nr:prolyl oligopeptidase family serine peptidase [Fimbriimonadaceae bacterium]
MRCRLFPTFLALVLASSAFGQKKILDHDVYDIWRSAKGSELSWDGKWFVYVEGPAVGDNVLIAKSTTTNTVYRVERGSAPRIMPDSRYVVFTILPAKADVDKAKKEKKKPADMPKNELGIMDLADGKVTTIPRLSSVRTPVEGNNWIVYKEEAVPATPPAQPTPPPTQPPAKPEEPKKEPEKPQKKKDHPVGSEIILRNLSTGAETKIADVVEYDFSRNGGVLAYTISSKSGDTDGVYVVSLSGDVTKPIVVDQGLGNYRSLALDKDGTRIAYATDKNDYKAEKPLFEGYWAKIGQKPSLFAKSGSSGMPKDWILSPSRIRFSESGSRVIFATTPKPEEEKKDETPDDEKVSVDIWNWKDPELQPMQLLRATMERNRTYTAIYETGTGNLIQVETTDTTSAVLSNKGDGKWAMVMNNRPYRQLISWDTEYADVYLMNLETGQRKQLLTQTDDNPSFSPSGNYVSWFDSKEKHRMVANSQTHAIVNVSKAVPYPIWDEMDDHPAPPPPYGGGMWTDGEKSILIYDRFDVWACDPTGSKNPVCLTLGAGRLAETVLRPIRTDLEADTIGRNFYLSASSLRTRAAGFFRLENGNLNLITMQDKAFGGLSKAKNAEVYLTTREDFDEFRDFWISGPTLTDMRKVSDINPQQKDYNWCKSELVTWYSLDGKPLQGILTKPENFDPGKKYPMMVYFYETHSQDLHRYISPTPSASTINPTFFASRGYIVFQPDIPYEVGYPGPSAVKAILSGVSAILSRGYVDPKRVGAQGQSWGGYQVAYLVTQTNMFAAAGAGAAVSNMVSAYGGIRWGSGMVRQMQYEKGQSRIGGSLWENPLRYIENSPIFWADKVETPLLMMNNDKDGAVPWYQGIELFTALRRLQKPVWMLVYNNEDHNLIQRHNRKDLSVRLSQFFDHYLLGTPQPVWMSTGVPATKKGKTMGTDFGGG